MTINSQQKMIINVIGKALTVTNREACATFLRCAPMTLEEVGREFGVTRERIRQIEAKALERIRFHERAKQLKSY